MRTLAPESLREEVGQRLIFAALAALALAGDPASVKEFTSTRIYIYIYEYIYIHMCSSCALLALANTCASASLVEMERSVLLPTRAPPGEGFFLLGKTRFQRRPVLPRWWYEYIALRFFPAWIPNNRMAQVADAQNA